MWPAAAQAARTALALRYALLPHLYTTHYLAHRTGGGVARPMLTRWPGMAEARGVKAADQQVRLQLESHTATHVSCVASVVCDRRTSAPRVEPVSHSQNIITTSSLSHPSLVYCHVQWLLGDGVLVAPVLEEGQVAVRGAWVPPGAWYSAWDYSHVLTGEARLVLQHAVLTFSSSTCPLCNAASNVISCSAAVLRVSLCLSIKGLCTVASLTTPALVFWLCP